MNHFGVAVSILNFACGGSVAESISKVSLKSLFIEQI